MPRPNVKSHPQGKRTGKRNSAPSRRAVLRLFLRVFMSAAQMYVVPLKELVPADQPLPCDDEMIESISITLGIIAGNNPCGVVVQFGIGGAFSGDESSAFLPITPPKEFSRSGKLHFFMNMPHITRQFKGVLSNSSNRLMINITALPGQIDRACLVLTCNTKFKVPILEFHATNIGTPTPYQNLEAVDAGTAPAHASDPPQFVLESSLNLLFQYDPKTSSGSNAFYRNKDQHGSFKVTQQGLPPGVSGTVTLAPPNYQGLYSEQGYPGTITYHA